VLKQREELYPNGRIGQEDTGVRPVTKGYTTPYSAFRQVFALRASEEAATAGRIEVLNVLVNGTAVLGISLIRLRLSKGFRV
jgi:hypothetical protein